MVSYRYSTIAAIAALSLGILSGCSTASPTENTSQGAALSAASPEAITDLLPTQAEILAEQSYAYLMANPTVAAIDVAKEQGAQHRVPSKLAAKSNSSGAALVNDKCAVYEQAALGLISTPAGSWEITSGSRRNIIAGQSGIDQISGFTSVLTTDTPEQAAKLLNDFKSNSAGCAEALKAYYPKNTSDFAMQPPAVDAATNTVTMHGTYDGKDFYISFYQQDKYIFSTWFSANDSNGKESLSQVADTVQQLILKNISEL